MKASYWAVASLIVWGVTAVGQAQMPPGFAPGQAPEMVPGGAMGAPGMYGPQGNFPGNFAVQGGPPGQVGYPAEYAGSDSAGGYGGGYGGADGGGPPCPPPPRRGWFGAPRGSGNHDEACPPLLGPVASSGGCFFLRGEALIMRRTNSFRTVALVANNAAVVRLTSGDLSFRNEAGQRVDAGYEFNDAAKFVFSFIELQNFNAANGVVSAANDLFLPGAASANSSNFYQASSMQAEYRTMLKSYEANYLNATIFDRLSLLGGFRYLDLIDRLAVVSTRTSGAANLQGTSDYILRTTNRLLGGQIGAQVRYDIDLWSLEFTGKTGLYDNGGTFTTFFGDNNNTVTINPQTAPATRHSLAAVNDINVSFSRRLSNHVAVRAGYNALWIDNVALAPDQFDITLNQTNQNQVRTGGDIFIYGTNVGLELRF